MEEGEPRPRVVLGDLTRIEFRALVESKQTRIGMVPVAATEQHLHHLEMSTDCTEIEFVTRKAAQRVAPLVVITPTISVGVSEHHMKHIGSLTSRWEVFTEYVFDHVESLARGGLEKVVIINGHGGNTRPLASVMDGFRARLARLDLRFFSYWDLLPEDLPLTHLGSQTAPGHAQEFETSALYYIAPHKVRAEMAENTDAKQATRAKGQALMDAVVDALANYLCAFAAGRAPAIEPVSWVSGEVKRGIEWHPFVSRGTPLAGEGKSACSLPTETYE